MSEWGDEDVDDDDVCVECGCEVMVLCVLLFGVFVVFCEVLLEVKVKMAFAMAREDEDGDVEDDVMVNKGKLFVCVCVMKFG